MRRAWVMVLTIALLAACQTAPGVIDTGDVIDSQAAVTSGAATVSSEAAPDANFWYSYGCGTRVAVYAACVKEYETVGTTSRTNAALCLMGISHTTADLWVYWNFNNLSVQIFW